MRRSRFARWGGTAALVAALVGVGVVATWADLADAQRTGGSFGGGSFGGGGGGGFRGGGGGFGGGGFHGGGFGGGFRSSRSYGGYSGGGGCTSGSLCLLVVVLVLVVGLRGMVAAGRSWSSDARVIARPMSASLDRMDVSALMIALDARARPFLQKRLDELARAGSIDTPGGLHALLIETVSMLRRARLAWLYAGVYNTAPTTPDRAEAFFRQTAATLRSRYQDELVRRGELGVVSAATPEMKAREHEGEGLVLVSLVVAARRELPDVHRAADLAQLDALVRTIGALGPHELVALEVVWSPAAENDRMSSAELESLYPELHKLPGVERVGRVFCRYCAGPFAHELPRCPHCGGPAGEAGA